jgi:vitamin B12/bleomycin/antimicrobial peptide transport system ATP-binding/permease protein
MRWRLWMTNRYLQEWLHERTYYRMQFSASDTDNPDQRIAEDLRIFVENTLDLVLGAINALTTLGAFLFILWGLSGSIEFQWNGETYEIYGYMVWVALAYSLGGTWITHVVGKKLIQLMFNQQRYEADFRFNLVRFRENAEGVALYHGEQGELSGFRQRFAQVVKNWWGIMMRTKWLNAFRFGYNTLANVFPVVVAAPRYFSGKFTLGDVTQTAGAFGQVQGALSWFINAYVTFATWKATVDRLTGFHNAVLRAQQQQRTNPGVAVETGIGQDLQLKHVDLILPNGQPLLDDVNLDLVAGTNVVVRGPSGSGKSTLFRAIAGIWPFGSGSIALPQHFSGLFLPQRPYFPLGSLRAAVSYPAVPGTFADDQVREVLSAVGLPQLANRLDEEANWSMQLSGGEQQRVAFARALLHKPQWLFLDEATSALDDDAQASLHRLLLSRLTTTTIVSIAHRAALAGLDERTLQLTRSSQGGQLVERAADATTS